jgi:predicted Rossmann fold flavoprotein
MMPEPIVVIGAGAAGLMAAIFAGRKGGRPVILLERTRDGGRKILVSGGGRCNVLPEKLQPESFVSDSSPNSLRKILTSWPLAEQRTFFEQEAGVPLKFEPDPGKFFPLSDRARDVRDALFGLARAAGVEVLTEARVKAIAPVDGRWRVELPNSSLDAARVIVATGGFSMPGTGSEGDGFAWLRALGHTIHRTYPALTALLSEPPRHANLAGVSREVTLFAPLAGRIARARGGFLFTHRGYSGPAVLDLSHLVVRAPEQELFVPELFVQWTAFDASAWEEYFRRAPGGLLIKTALERQVESRLAAQLLQELAIDERRPLAQLRREERQALIQSLTRYPLKVTGHAGYAKAEVTGGGVALGEVDPRTLESRLHPGLFLCGEILDAFGPIGGHNFSWAWATGRLAGRAA